MQEECYRFHKQVASRILREEMSTSKMPIIANWLAKDILNHYEEEGDEDIS